MGVDLPTLNIFPAILLLIYSIGQVKGICENSLFKEGKFSSYCVNQTEIPSFHPVDINGIIHHIDELVLHNSLEEDASVLTDDFLYKSNLRSLAILHLENCHIQEIEDEAFRGGDNLTILSLTNNELQSLDPSVFQYLVKLQKLNLSGNPLANLDEDFLFPSLTITILDLSNCQINYIHPSVFKNLKKLRKLHLSSNDLTSFDWTTLQPLRGLSEVFLEGNPWHCDCNVKVLRRYLIDKNIKYVLNSGTGCSCSTYTPNRFHQEEKNVAGARWIDVSDEVMTCPPEIMKLSVRRSEENVRVTCEYFGSPEPEVVWLRKLSWFDGSSGDRVILPSKTNSRYAEEDEPLKEGNRETMKTSFHHRQDLVIRGAEAGKDDGDYTCSVFVSGPNVVAEKTVTVNLTEGAISGKKMQFDTILAIIIAILGIGSTATFVISIMINYGQYKHRETENVLRNAADSKIQEVGKEASLSKKESHGHDESASYGTVSSLTRASV